MGCDIHTNVEVRQADGSWKNYHEWSDSSPKGEFMDNRNYDLFAILADVRNGRGFAGVVTGAGFVPIDDPRGVPPDASPEYEAWVAQWDGDGHSHSYFTVAEMLAYDWTQTSKKTGLVSPTEFMHWKKNGEPNGWCGDVSGGTIKKLSAEEMGQLIKDSMVNEWEIYHGEKEAMDALHKFAGVGVSAFGSLYARVNWEIPYYKAGRQFFGEDLPRLLRLGKPEDVRICFFFDN